jgi:hypothetical protein
MSSPDSTLPEVMIQIGSQYDAAKEKTMTIPFRANSLNYFIALILLTGAILLLASCTPTPLPTAAPVVNCPTAEPTDLTSFNEKWGASPHADEKAEAFRHWDASDPQEIPITCAKCHSRPGFIDFLGVDGTDAGKVNKPVKIGTTITCFNCHNEMTPVLTSVVFPSGARINDLGRESFCINCHHGNASTMSVDINITKANLADEDTPSPDLAFVNSHSISAATPFGSEVHGAYEYENQTYRGRFNRGEEFFACTRCHDPHTLKVDVNNCVECHTFDRTDAKNIRVNSTDLDGDGNTTEGIAYEIDQLHNDLYVALQNYAKSVAGLPIVYEPATYPYFFIDSNGNGTLDQGENVIQNAYNMWTPRLLRAAYNYNYVSHDPGAFAHNSTYILQILYDSLVDIGGDAAQFIRP